MYSLNGERETWRERSYKAVSVLCILFTERVREGERQRQREREREIDRQRDIETDRGMEGETETERSYRLLQCFKYSVDRERGGGRDRD